MGLCLSVCLSDLDLSRKMQIIKLPDANCKHNVIADRFRVDILTISKLFKNRNKITKEFHSSLSATTCKHLHASVYTDVKNGMV